MTCVCIQGYEGDASVECTPGKPHFVSPHLKQAFISSCQPARGKALYKFMISVIETMIISA